MCAPLAQGKLLIKLRTLSLVPVSGNKYSWQQSGLAQFLNCRPPLASAFVWAPGLSDVRLVDGRAVLPASMSETHARCHLCYFNGEGVW